MLRGLLIGGISALSLAFLFIASISLLLPPPGSGPQRVATAQPSAPVLRDQSERVPRVPEPPSAPVVEREAADRVTVASSAAPRPAAPVPEPGRGRANSAATGLGTDVAAGIDLPAGSEFNRRREDGAARTPEVDATPRVVAVAEGFDGGVARDALAPAPAPQTQSADRPDQIEIAGLSAPPGAGAAPVVPERRAEGVPRTFGTISDGGEANAGPIAEANAPTSGEIEVASAVTRPEVGDGPDDVAPGGGDRVEIAVAPSGTADDPEGSDAGGEAAPVVRDRLAALGEGAPFGDAAEAEAEAEVATAAAEPDPRENVGDGATDVAEAGEPRLSDVPPVVKGLLVATLQAPARIGTAPDVEATDDHAAGQPERLLASRDPLVAVTRGTSPTLPTTGGGAPAIETIVAPFPPSDIRIAEVGNLPSDVGIVLAQESAPAAVENPSQGALETDPVTTEPATPVQTDPPSGLRTEPPAVVEGEAPATPSAPADPTGVFEVTDPVLPNTPAAEPEPLRLLDADGNPIRPRRLILDSERTEGAIVGDAEEKAAEAETGADTDAPALIRHAAAFDNPFDLPLFSVVLLYDGDAAFDAASLADLGIVATFAIDPSTPTAAEDAARLREAGHEVIWQASAFSTAATAQDIEVAIAGAQAAVPEVTGVIDGADGTFTRDRDALAALLPALSEAGLGFLSYGGGLNSGVRSAERAGVSATSVYRVLDGSGERPPVMMRYLDRATVEAAQTGAVVVTGRTTPEVLTALTDWIGGTRAELVGMAPLSAVLLASDGS